MQNVIYKQKERTAIHNDITLITMCTLLQIDPSTLPDVTGRINAHPDWAAFTAQEQMDLAVSEIFIQHGWTFGMHVVTAPLADIFMSQQMNSPFTVYILTGIGIDGLINSVICRGSQICVDCSLGQQGVVKGLHEDDTYVIGYAVPTPTNILLKNAMEANLDTLNEFTRVKIDPYFRQDVVQCIRPILSVLKEQSTMMVTGGVSPTSIN